MLMLMVMDPGSRIIFVKVDYLVAFKGFRERLREGLGCSPQPIGRNSFFRVTGNVGEIRKLSTKTYFIPLCHCLALNIRICWSLGMGSK